MSGGADAGSWQSSGGLAVLLAVLLACCGQASAPSAEIGSPAATLAASPDAPPIDTTDVLAEPSLDGRFAVDQSGRELAMTCWGVGDPTVFLEVGGGAIDELTGSPLVRQVAQTNRVCLYNRAGRAPSDPAPVRPREAEDYAQDFRALAGAAHIDPPFLLFGRSFGGMLVTFYASQFPGDVAGVVVFDSPAPSATMTAEEFPDGDWDAPSSVEHLNVRTGFENRFGKDPVHIAAPLILFSPSDGESPPDDQRYWLQVSDNANQVIVAGGEEVLESEAALLAESIRSLGP